MPYPSVVIPRQDKTKGGAVRYWTIEPFFDMCLIWCLKLLPQRFLGFVDITALVTDFSLEILHVAVYSPLI